MGSLRLGPIITADNQHRIMPTKAKRIAMAVNALAKGMGFPEMLRAHKKEKEQFGL